jgi:glycosyltransferase involved in cell wall biosynthesis
MKVLYLTQYFFTPDQAGGGRHFYHVKSLMAKGHQVDVLTAYVEDHMSREIPQKYRGKLSVKEYCQGIRVIKTYASANYGQGFLDRMKNYLSFMFCAILAGLSLRGSYDVVIASSPSLFVGLAGYILALFKRGRFVLEVRDLWPQSAIELGFLQNRCMIFLAKGLEKFLYRKAKAIIALTAGIKDTIAQMIKDPEKISLITNGVDEDIFLNPEPVDFNKISGLEDKFIAIYTGAHGVNNDLETIIKAAHCLKDHDHIRFVLIGGGDHKAQLIKMCREQDLKNILFLPPRPKQKIASYLAGADVCLLAIKKGAFFNGTLPNKLFDYLASGKPTVAAVPEAGESARLIEELKAGIVCAPEDGTQMGWAILQVYHHPEYYRALGEQVKKHALERYSRYYLAQELEAVLNKV